jgi:hypothetical protein
MSAVDERAAHIRMFSVPERAVGFSAVFQYATVAADWERLRLQVNRNPEPVLVRRRAIFGYEPVSVSTLFEFRPVALFENRPRLVWCLVCRVVGS